MYTFNCKIETDSVDYPAQNIVAAKFSQKNSLSILTRKFKPSGSAYLELENQGQGIVFDGSVNGLTIEIKTKQDLELLMAALTTASDFLEMLAEGHLPESIEVSAYGYRNKVDNTFDKNGEPLKETKLFTKGGIMPRVNLVDQDKPYSATYMRISNMNNFLNDWQDHLSEYASPFQMLADLEKIVMGNDTPETTLTMDYKDGGYILFDLVGVHYQGSTRIAEYQYSTSAS